MAAKLRRVIIAARFKASRPDQPTPEEISVLRLAWENAPHNRESRARSAWGICRRSGSGLQEGTNGESSEAVSEGEGLLRDVKHVYGHQSRAQPLREVMKACQVLGADD